MQSDNERRLQDLFRILGDQTRRSILELLAENGSMTVNEIASHFPHLVRSGISKHLMELRKVNVVFVIKRGRERYYQINPQPLQKLLKPWISKYEKYWDQRLEKLKYAAENKEKREQTEE